MGTAGDSPQRWPTTPEKGATQALTPTTSHRHEIAEVLGSPLEKPRLDGPDLPHPDTFPGASTPVPSSPRDEVYTDPSAKESQTPLSSPTRLAAGHTAGRSPEAASSPLQRLQAPKELDGDPLVDGLFLKQSVLNSSPKRLLSPDRPTLHAHTPGHMFMPSPMSRPWSSAKAPSSGRVAMAGSAVPPIPLKTFFVTQEEASQLPAEELRPTLIKAIEAVEMYERSATQFRSLANQLQLQSKLAAIEAQESAQRHGVESTLAHREVERLIAEVMGYNDASIDSEAIRRRLKKTRQKLRDMELLADERGREIAALRQELRGLKLASAQAAPKQISGLELLASQVLSQQTPQSQPQHQSQSEFQLYQASDKRRRPSSSSTISVRSDDTQEDDEQ